MAQNIKPITLPEEVLPAKELVGVRITKLVVQAPANKAWLASCEFQYIDAKGNVDERSPIVNVNINNFDKIVLADPTHAKLVQDVVDALTAIAIATGKLPKAT